MAKGDLIKNGDGHRISSDNVSLLDQALKRDKSKYGDVAVFEPSDIQIQQLSEIARVNLDGTDEVLAALGAEELSRAEFSIMRAGAYFVQLKRQAGHGAFIPALEAAGVSPNRAQRAMQIANYIAALPPEQGRRLAALPKSKLLPLVNADAEVIGELLEEGALDGDEALSVRELRQRLKKAEQRAIDAEVDRKTAESVRDRALEQMAAVSPSIDKAYAALRDQAVYLLERIAHENTLLGEIVETKLVASDWRGQPDARDRQAVAAVLYHALNGCVATSVHLLNEIEQTFGAFVTGGMRPDLQYTADEREHLQSLREAALSAAEQDFRSTEVDTRKKHKTRGRHS